MMKKSKIFILTLSAIALLLASCEKDPMAGRGSAPAIKLTVSGVADTKAQIITDNAHHSTYSSNIYEFLETKGFNISAYVTGKWSRDVIGQGSQVYDPGVYVDPGDYSGPYDESSYPTDDNKLKDILVSYDSSRDDPWRISGNAGTGYANHKFSWISGVPMNFFAYAPVSIKGSRSISKADTGTTSVDANFPFSYSALVQSDMVTSDNCDDLIFAYTQHTATFQSDRSKSDYGELTGGSTDIFSLKFHHALAQIRFCVDPADFSDIKLLYVKLFGPASTSGSSGYSGIATSGSCTFAGATGTFTWSDLVNRHIYSQTFNGTSGVSFASGVPDPSTNWVESTYDTDKTLHTCVGDVLFVIPQSLSECAVEIGIQEGSNPVQILMGHLPASTSGSTNVSWAPGKFYTYKLKRGSIDLLLTGGLGPYLPGWWD